MKVLVVGGGGREHAIVKALVGSGASVYAVMGNRNPGIVRAAEDAVVADLGATEDVVTWARSRGVALAVVGPEAPLGRGLADALEDVGIPTVGPRREAAQIELSKEFARNLMARHRVPGLVDYWAFDDLDDFRTWLSDYDAPFVLKPIGLTGGKGVRVWGDHFRTKGEAEAYAQEILSKAIGGQARFLAEAKVEGEEFSLQAFVDGRRVVAMPVVQDHKRAYEGDEGPNTGGMGSYSMADHLLPFLTKADYDEAVRVMQRTVDALRAEGLTYRGILYGGFILSRDGPRVLEFNARFGDPEAMNVLPVLESDFLTICQDIASGAFRSPARFAQKATVCKYVVPKGYGTQPQADGRIEVDEEAVRGTGAALFYASVNERDGAVFTTTSRSVAVVGVGDDLPAAEAQAEAALAHIRGDAIYVRHDIGRPDVVAKRVERMRRLRG